MNDLFAGTVLRKATKHLRRVRKMFSDLWSESLKTVSCTVRNPWTLDTLQKFVGDFCLNFGGFCCWRILLGNFLEDFSGYFSCEKLGPLQNRKRPHKENRAKIPPKYRKSYFLSIFDVFLGYFEGCCVFLSCRGPSLSQYFSHKNEEKKSGDKIRKKIRRPKNKNQRKIRSAKIRP